MDVMYAWIHPSKLFVLCTASVVQCAEMEGVFSLFIVFLRAVCCVVCCALRVVLFQWFVFTPKKGVRYLTERCDIHPRRHLSFNE